MMRAGIAIAMLVWAAGCGSTTTSGPDGGQSDASETGTGGLTLVFLAEIQDEVGEGGGEGFRSWDSASNRGVPANQTRVQMVSLELEEVRAVGDTGAEEEDRLAVTWNEDDAHCVSFAAARPGKYSQIKANIASYRLQGTTSTMANPNLPFVINDTPATGITVVVSVGERIVEIGETTDIIVRFSSHAVASAVDWDSIPLDEGTAIVDGESPAIDGVRAAIIQSMVPADDQPAFRCVGNGDNEGPG